MTVASTPNGCSSRLDDAGELRSPPRSSSRPARRRGTCDIPAAAETARTKCSSRHRRARPAARCRAARRRTGGRAAPAPPVSIDMVSPTEACSTYCSDVASATTGIEPSANARRSSSHGFARSASVSAHRRREREAAALDEAALRRDDRRDWSVDTGSGSSRRLPARTRKRVNVTAPSSGDCIISASRPAASFGLCSSGTSDSREEHVAAGAGLADPASTRRRRAGTRRPRR